MNDAAKGIDVTILVLVLYVLAAMRVTRLINYDQIMYWLHTSTGNKFGAGSWQVEFLECPYCIGMWVALSTTWAPILLTGLSWWLYPLIALATSMVIGLLAPLSAEKTTLEPM